VEDKVEVDNNQIDEEALFNINTSPGKTTSWNVVVTLTMYLSLCKLIQVPLRQQCQRPHLRSVYPL